MILPAKLSPLSAEGWGVVITYDEDGHVSDEDADQINYADLLKDMQKKAPPKTAPQAPTTNQTPSNNIAPNIAAQASVTELDLVQRHIEAEQELGVLVGRIGLSGRPGQPVQPRVCLLVHEFPQQRIPCPCRRLPGALVRGRCLADDHLPWTRLRDGADRVVSHPRLAERVGGDQADRPQLVGVR